MSNPYVDHVNGNNQTIDIRDTECRGQLTNLAQSIANALGANNGIATLDSNGKLPVSQLPSDSDKLDTAVLTGITESSTVATRAYTENDRFFLEPTGEYCMATSAISIGETLVENTNYTVITLEGVVASILTMGDQLNTIKADKVSSATNGNLAGLNATGNPTDSGISGDMTTTSATGNPISIADLKSAQIALNPVITYNPIQDLHGQSKPYPAGGGKNKLNMTDRSMSAAGWLATAANVNLPAGKYTFSCNLSGTGASGQFQLFSNGTEIARPSFNFVNGLTTTTFTCSQNVDTINLWSNATGSFSKFQIESGESYTSYAPYENICPISGYDKIEVLSCQKNLFNPYGEYIGRYGTTTINVSFSNNTLSLTRSSSGDRFIEFLFKVEIGKSYRLTSSATIGFYVKYYTEKPTVAMMYDGSQASSNTVLTPTGSWLGIEFELGESTMSLTDLQLEEGSTATTYEPYHKTTDLSESLGQTVYGGTYDPRAGVFTVKYGIVDLGIKNWSYHASSSATDTNRFSLSASAEYIANIKVPSASDVANVVCEIYSPSSNTQNVNGGNTRTNYISVTTGGNLVVTDTRFTSPSDFKTALDGVYLVYELADSAKFTIQLTPHEIALSQGYNYISTNGTSISLAYHNGELATHADVEQLAETVNGLGEYVDAQRDILRFDYSTLSMADALLKLEEVLLQDKAYIISLLSTGDTVNGTYLRCGSYRTFLGSAAYNGKIYSCHRYGSNATWTIKSVTPT